MLSFEDPAELLEVAGPFLASDPVRHNLILTLLLDERERPGEGRYWVALEGRRALAVAMASTRGARIIITATETAIATTLARSIAESGEPIAGISGEAATVAAFVGQFAETRRCGASPLYGLRLYELAELTHETAAVGRLDAATAADRELVVEWLRQFHSETGVQTVDPDEIVDTRLDKGRIRLWSVDGRPRSMVMHSEAVEGVARVQEVYTPSVERSRGFAGAAVAAVTGEMLRAGQRCVLYTMLSNPVSNALFRGLGYRAVEEGLEYRFDQGRRAKGRRNDREVHG